MDAPAVDMADALRCFPSVPLGLLDQLRRTFELFALSELADSIKRWASFNRPSAHQRGEVPTDLR